jgi:hypothetical protein
MEDFMKCALEMDSCDMIYIPSFIKIGFKATLMLFLGKGSNVGITDG